MPKSFWHAWDARVDAEFSTRYPQQLSANLWSGRSFPQGGG
jgi:hypothetical protein